MFKFKTVDVAVLLQAKGFGVGLCVLAKVLQCVVGFLIPNAPEGRKAGGKKIKTLCKRVCFLLRLYLL